MGKYEQITKALQILGLESSATWKEIKATYHALLKKWHPDFSRGNRDVSHDRTKEIIAAYKIIRDYCEHYRFSFSREEVEKYISPEELWLRQFGRDPIWGNPDDNE